jgi:hypothetical protein
VNGDLRACAYSQLGELAMSVEQVGRVHVVGLAEPTVRVHFVKHVGIISKFDLLIIL